MQLNFRLIHEKYHQSIQHEIQQIPRFSEAVLSHNNDTRWGRLSHLLYSPM